MGIYSIDGVVFFVYLACGRMVLQDRNEQDMPLVTEPAFAGGAAVAQSFLKFKFIFFSSLFALL